jgi:ribonucleotide reductase alpha subunit
MSTKYFTHATPTLFNAGTPRPQLSSCYLIGMENDSIDGIYNTLKDCANISKWAGGIGLHIHNIRASGSHINGTNGTSNGIVPMLRNFNATARYVDQGGGKRNGSFAIYLEPWHADIEDFLDLKKNHGDEEMRARDLFYALWIPDLFMEKVKTDQEWGLFCPHKCPGLADCYGKDFDNLYNTYMSTGSANKVIKARDLWFKILDSQMETGTPYLLYKDAANLKSNQQNLGTIKSSNLCVAPETKILTDNGYFEIQSLVDKHVNVWNGEEFSETIVTKTGINQSLITIETSDGSTLDCTSYHKFHIQNDGKIDIVDAHNLKIDDQLIKCNFPIIDGNEIYLTSMINRLIVPINASVINKINWLINYFDYYTSSSIIINGTLHLSNISKEVITNMKLMLQTCGINPKMRFLSNLYSLLICSFDLYKLIELGFNTTRININSINKIIDSRPDITIKKIIYTNRTDDTYCFNESKKHTGVFNGIITGNCTEIIQYSNENETAVCNLASIGLSMFVNLDKTFDYEKLHSVTKVITRNLNKVIDINFYPTKKTRLSNLLHRPIGIGVQGLADAFALMNIAFYSNSAKVVNKHVFETIYHAALESSNEIAIERQNDLNDIWVPGAQLFTDNTDPICNIYCPVSKEMQSVLQKHKPILAELTNLNRSLVGAYSSFEGSPASKGILQFDMWNVEPSNERYDWSILKESIKTYGLRNSLLVAPMPTASTSQILGNNECFEPFTSNIYSRRTNAGEFIIVNTHLMKELMELGLWNEELKDNIILNKGSIQHIDFIPQHIRDKYKIVWEIPMKHLIDMAADRGAFICQSQSLNLWMEDPEYKALTNMHFYAWQSGLKTGIYYLRRKAKHQAQQFTIVPTKNETNNNEKILEDEPCEMCSS